MWARSLLAILLLVGILAPPAAAQEKDWTILVYMDADNNLEPVGILDFLELSSVGSNADVNIVVQFDRAAGFDASHGDWKDTRRFFVTPGLAPNPQNSIRNMPEQNMADPATLVSFVDWGIANYPARHYFLVLWDHGDGWRGVVVDDDPVSNDRLTVLELRTALEAIVTASGRRIDLLGLDGCRMTFEIEYELVDYVDYFVGSEKDEPLDGWPYDRLLTALVADPSMPPETLAATLVDRYVESYVGKSPYSVALSAVNAAALRPLLGKLNDFLGELAIHQPYFTAQVVAARNATERYERGGLCCGDEYDLHHFVENVLSEAPSRRLERRGLEVLAAIDVAVTHERHWDNPSAVNGVPAKNAHGLSLWFPSVGGDPGYAALGMSQDGGWDEFLSAYSIGTRPQVAANAAVRAEDRDADGRNEAIAVEYRPAANGTMAVDLYRDGSFALSTEFSAIVGRSDTARLPLRLGGWHEVSAYLIVNGDLVNLTVASGLAIHELIRFNGTVSGVDGRPADGATVVLRNLATNATLTTTTANGGRYGFDVSYPSWFNEGDALELEVRAGDIVARVSFAAHLGELGPYRAFTRDVSVNPAGMALWIAAIIALAVLAAVAFSGLFLYRRRYERFRHPP